MDRERVMGDASGKDERPMGDTHDTHGEGPGNSRNAAGRRRFLRTALKVFGYVVLSVIFGRDVTVHILRRITDDYGTILWDFAHRNGRHTELGKNVPAAFSEHQFHRMIHAIEEKNEDLLALMEMGKSITLLRKGTRIYVLRQFEASRVAHIEVVDTGERWWTDRLEIFKW